MQSKRRRQPKQQRKKGLFSKTKNFARAAHFFLYFFACVLHDDNVELQKLPGYTFYVGNVVCGPVHFSFAAAPFYLGGR